MIRVEYDYIKDKLDNLDILLFSSKGPISNLIKFITKSKWSHVGCVLKIRGELFCWESTTLNRSKRISGVKKGVQLTSLEKRLSDYKGEVGLRRLNISNRDIYFLKKLDMFKKQMDGVEYEEIVEWMGSDFDPNHFDLDETNKMLAEEDYGCIEMMY